jgi:hypothetical protein
MQCTIPSPVECPPWKAAAHSAARAKCIARAYDAKKERDASDLAGFWHFIAEIDAKTASDIANCSRGVDKKTATPLQIAYIIGCENAASGWNTIMKVGQAEVLLAAKVQSAVKLTGDIARCDKSYPCAGAIA